jgi:hypothetical protein
MESYRSTIDVLADELEAVGQAFRGLTAQEWATSTLLVPVDPQLPHWTVFELAGHFDISIGLTRMLMNGRGDDRPARDRTSFFINPRSETAPVVYGYAYTMVEPHTTTTMPDALHETFAKTISEARALPPDTVGPGYFAPMRLDDFVASRIVEAVVHGLDLTLALGRPPICSPEAVAVTAAILDDLLARRTIGSRPGDLTDDLTWVLAASGRAVHPDNRLPLIG